MWFDDSVIDIDMYSDLLDYSGLYLESNNVFNNYTVYIRAATNGLTNTIPMCSHVAVAAAVNPYMLCS